MHRARILCEQVANVYIQTQSKPHNIQRVCVYTYARMRKTSTFEKKKLSYLFFPFIGRQHSSFFAGFFCFFYFFGFVYFVVFLFFVRNSYARKCVYVFFFSFSMHFDYILIAHSFREQYVCCARSAIFSQMTP